MKTLLIPASLVFLLLGNIPIDRADYTGGFSVECSKIYGKEKSHQFVILIKNKEKVDLKFSIWNTPFDKDAPTGIFRVEDSQGNRAKYSGLRITRSGSPGPGDFITLAPGEALAAIVDLTDTFEIPSGKFTVKSDFSLNCYAKGEGDTWHFRDVEPGDMELTFE